MTARSRRSRNRPGENSDRQAVLVGLIVAGACWAALPVPGVVVVFALAAAVILRSWVALVAALALFASFYSAHEWRHLDAPVPTQVSGVATIVHDPKTVGHATSAEVKLDGCHYELWAYGSPAYQLLPLLAGDRVYVSGRTRALSGVATATYRRRHIAASVNVAQVTFVDHGSFVSRTANGVRTLIANGASQMPVAERGLFTGFVYGDDRNEGKQIHDDFQSSGLSHLLAVSGENVAFVLLLAVPVVKRFSLWGRFIGGIGVLLLFGVITRWEPSVVRAEMMASVALFASFQGRAVSKWFCLSAGSTLALLVDPFLVGSAGFLLSVSACVGMAGLGEVFVSRLRGPFWLRRAIAYSAAAQLGVAPVQFVIFHQMPVVGLLTNVAAEPLAGLIMVWGVVGGLIAGVVPVDVIKVLIHVPDTVALWIVRLIAHTGAQLEAPWWGKCIGVTLSFLVVVALAQRREGSNLESHDGSSASGIPDQRRRPRAA